MRLVVDSFLLFSKTDESFAKRCAPLRTAAFIGLSALLVPSMLWAAPGALDPTFASSGVDDNLDTYELVTSLALRSDERVLVGGSYQFLSGASCGQEWEIFARGANGGADSTFANSAGQLLFPVGGNCNNNHQASSGIGSVVVQSDGKILATGWGLDANGNQAVRLMRWNADGSIDTSYHATGGVKTSFDTSAFPGSLALQKDGKALVAGLQRGATANDPQQVFLLRYSASGNLDGAFGTAGLVEIPGADFGGPGATSGSITIQPDGKILLGVVKESGTPEVIRFTSSGQLDPTFGSGGVAAFGFGTTPSTGLAVQPDGKIVAATFTDSGGFVFRLLANGSLDTAFNTQGWVGLNLASLYCLALTPTGQILASGWNANGLETARVTSGGQLDTSYTNGSGNTGYVNDGLPGGGSAECDSIQLLPDGRFIVAGTDVSKTMVARFQGDALDLQPDAFAFSPVTGAPISTVEVSNTVVVSGLTAGAKVPILVSGSGLYRINAEAWTTAIGYVANGDKIRVKHTSAPTHASQVTTTLQVGGLNSPNSPWVVRGGQVNATFTSTTL